MTAKTSISHPLQIAEVHAPGGGTIGVTFCPGKHQRFAATGSWERDLKLDLAAVCGWGVGVFVTLITREELRELKVENMGEAAQSAGLAWLHLPILDATTPTLKWEDDWRNERATVHEELDRGGRVVVHCKGGLGRAGTVAALILAERGIDPADAIRAVRAARKGAIETSAQAAYVAAPRAAWREPELGEASSQAAAEAVPVNSRKLTHAADWFFRLTGFQEGGWQETRAQLEVHGATLRSKVNGTSYAIGELELVSLADLRERLSDVKAAPGRMSFTNSMGDVRELHRAPEYAGALFQVASQFNLLEMVGPGVTPEQGVTRYAGDPTQGPACAIAAGAATIYRNYFAPVGDESGQTAKRQLDGLADLGADLATTLNRPVAALWDMRNGYAMCTAPGLAAIGDHLRGIDEAERDRLRGLLRIGVHRDVEVTDSSSLPSPRVTQAFCSALPVAYGSGLQAAWEPLARLILEAAYEATLAEATASARHRGSNIVLLTRLGGGAFGNADPWIDDAIARALRVYADAPLDVRLVSYSHVPRQMRALEAGWKKPRSRRSDLSAVSRSGPI